MKGLDFKHPIGIQIQNHVGIGMSKQVFDINQYLKATNIENVCGVAIDSQFVGIIQDQKLATLIIAKQLHFTNVLKALQCQIDEEVNVVNENSNEIYETYIINGYNITRKISTLDDNKLKWFKSPSLIKRRKDFHGIHFKAMTEQDGKWSKIKNTFPILAPFFIQNNTYDVSNLESGVVIDLLKIMGSHLNFTTSYYLRKDRKWGSVVRYKNNTIKGTGFVGDVFFKRADIIAAYASMTLRRYPYIDFIPSEFQESK